jgi:hypothetical protein
MNESSRVTRDVPPELDPISILEAHRMWMFLATSEGGQHRQTANPTQVGQHLDGARLSMPKRDPSEAERILDDHSADDFSKDAASS